MSNSPTIQSKLSLKRILLKRYKITISLMYITLFTLVLLSVLDLYKRLPNIDKDSLQSICDIISTYDTRAEMIFERIRFVIIVIGIILSKRKRLLFHMFLAYKMIACEVYVILRYIIDGYAGFVDCFKSMYPFGMIYIMVLFFLKNVFIDNVNNIGEKRKNVHKRQIVTLIIFVAVMFFGLVLEIKSYV